MESVKTKYLKYIAIVLTLLMLQLCGIQEALGKRRNAARLENRIAETRTARAVIKAEVLLMKYRLMFLEIEQRKTLPKLGKS
ncbi:MAG: hypothetical protein GY757_10130 [bacterium]|nr:hypothetical protein [bacterium]